MPSSSRQCSRILAATADKHEVAPSTGRAGMARISPQPKTTGLGLCKRTPRVLIKGVCNCDACIVPCIPSFTWTQFLVPSPPFPSNSQALRVERTHPNTRGCLHPCQYVVFGHDVSLRRASFFKGLIPRHACSMYLTTLDRVRRDRQGVRRRRSGGLQPHTPQRESAPLGAQRAEGTSIACLCHHIDRTND